MRVSRFVNSGATRHQGPALTMIRAALAIAPGVKQWTIATYLSYFPSMLAIAGAQLGDNFLRCLTRFLERFGGKEIAPTRAWPPPP